MSFHAAVIGIFVLIVVMAIYIPITGELLPTMLDTMGASTAFMVSMTVVVILAGAIFMFIRQSMSNDNSNFMEVYK